MKSPTMTKICRRLLLDCVANPRAGESTQYFGLSLLLLLTSYPPKEIFYYAWLRTADHDDLSRHSKVDIASMLFSSMIDHTAANLQSTPVWIFIRFTRS